MRVLIVEDDVELATVLGSGLREQGFDAATAGSYDEGLLRAVLGSFDVLILDVMLPGGSGFDLCRALRTDGVVTPVLMLTARDALDDRVTGLEAGADDYLVKPFAFRELLARLRALARRPAALLDEVVHIADLEVDLRSHAVRRQGDRITLTAQEFRLLEFFVRHRGKVMDRASISAHVWDENHDPFTNVLEVLIRRLRRKIDDPYEPKLIRTIRRAGYRFGG
jgi:DNA-binding response OmpR family regulator